MSDQSTDKNNNTFEKPTMSKKRFEKILRKRYCENSPDKYTPV